ncbi:MAG: putative toxin-antitoxin system toxin component, PIN family [Gammaproteobacteria bacterium]|nr:putative toxin-antitoxin system toxin component, PIN family [Gammaproteobacteria bacterium]
MQIPHVVIDTNVVISTMRSRLGASFKLLSLIDSQKFEFSVSVALVLEYESALMRSVPFIPRADVEILLDYICEIANHQKTFYLWRPVLRDPNDDLVVEVAIAGNCDTIVTFNRRDFDGTQRFGIRIMTPREFLDQIGEIQ